MRGVTTEELRAFLTATLIHPAKARGLVAWVRARFLETPPPGPAVVTRGNLGKTPSAPGHDRFFTQRLHQGPGLKLFALAWAVLIWATVQFAISRGITASLNPVRPRRFRAQQNNNQPSIPAGHPHASPVQFTFSNLPVLKMSAARDVLALTVQPSTWTSPCRARNI